MLIEPHGGTLCELIVPENQKIEWQKKAVDFKDCTLNPRQLCDLELLMNGGFSPLKGFLNKNDYESVIENNRLADGTVWPIPITLDVSEKIASDLKKDSYLALRDEEGVLLAVLAVEDVWKPDLNIEAMKVFQSTDPAHPGVGYLLSDSGSVYIGGEIIGIEYPRHYDYKLLRQTPSELRAQFERMGWINIVAFQTRNPMHRAHKEITLRAAKKVGGNLLIHPVVGMTKPGDVDHYTRVRCYQKIMPKYPAGTAALSLLPLAMRMGGPREALWHAIIRKNFGCTHFIVGRDHAGPGVDSSGNPYYGPYDAQDLVKQFEAEIGIKMVPFQMMVFVENRAEYQPINEISEGIKTLNISGTELRRRLANGLDIPDWFTYSDVVEELRKTYPPKSKQGFTVFFTGLSGSGKSTVANGLLVKLMETGKRRVTLLDGDVVRQNLSSELGFSKEHRDLNIRRIGFVASEITKNGGIAICAPIAPYQKVRREVRDLVSQDGAFIEIFVSTPLEVCETRDRKGLYSKARQGIIKGFTGIDDPYESPQNAEIVLDTSNISPEQAVQEVLLYLEKQGYLG